MLSVKLVSGNGQDVQVNEAGELIVAAGSYDIPVFNELAEPGTAYNYFKPDGVKQFLLTGFLAYGDKQVSGTTNATVTIYEASSPTTTTVDKVIIQFEIGQNQSVPFPNVRILTNHGVYLNAKTDDDDVHMTIFGHFVNLSGEGVTQ